MAGSFRRANLRGSDELFRPTRPGGEEEMLPPAPVRPPAPEPARVIPRAPEAHGAARPQGQLVRLSDEEVELIVDALQRLKYPTSSKPATKPPMDLFERYEELRKRLLDGTG